MSDTNAKIRAKGLEHTGVTEEHANQMYERVGSHYVGWVDLKVVKRSEDDDGQRLVELAIDAIELAGVDEDAELVRRRIRAQHYERGLAVNGGSQLPIEGSDEPTVDQVRGEELTDAESEASGGEAAEYPHRFQDGPDALCTECGLPAGMKPHQDWLALQDQPAGVGSPFEVPEPEPAA